MPISTSPHISSKKRHTRGSKVVRNSQIQEEVHGFVRHMTVANVGNWDGSHASLEVGPRELVVVEPLHERDLHVSVRLDTLKIIDIP